MTAVPASSAAASLLQAGAPAPKRQRSDSLGAFASSMADAMQTGRRPAESSLCVGAEPAAPRHLVRYGRSDAPSRDKDLRTKPKDTPQPDSNEPVAKGPILSKPTVAGSKPSKSVDSQPEVEDPTPKDLAAGNNIDDDSNDPADEPQEPIVPAVAIQVADPQGKPPVASVPVAVVSETDSIPLVPLAATPVADVPDSTPVTNETKVPIAEPADDAAPSAANPGSSTTPAIQILISRNDKTSKPGGPTVADLLKMIGHAGETKDDSDDGAPALSGAEIASTFVKQVVRPLAHAQIALAAQPDIQPATAGIPHSTAATAVFSAIGAAVASTVLQETPQPVAGIKPMPAVQQAAPAPNQSIDPALAAAGFGGLSLPAHFTGTIGGVSHSPAIAASVVEQVVDQLKANFTGTSSEFSMTLKPESLGNIDVRIKVDGDRVHVRLAADGQTHDLLRAGLVDLRSSLGNFGDRDVTIEVAVRQDNGFFPGGGFSGNSQFDSRAGGNRGRSARREAVGAVATDGDIPAPIDSSALVDYRI